MSSLSPTNNNGSDDNHGDSLSLQQQQQSTASASASAAVNNDSTLMRRMSKQERIFASLEIEDHEEYNNHNNNMYNNNDNDDDCNNINNQHSLPMPDEIKIDAFNNSRNSNNNNNNRNKHDVWPMLFCIIGSMLSLSLILGLSIGLTNNAKRNNDDNNYYNKYYTNGKPQKQPPITYGDNRSTHESNLANYIWNHDISTRSDLTTPSTPQARAIEYLTYSDELKLQLPKTNKEHETFILRYIMVVLYYTTNGHLWNQDLNFLSDKDTCQWNLLFQDRVGKTGVLCHPLTNEFLGLNFVYNNLDGSIPDEIGHLTGMIEFRSLGNNLRGKIPTTIGKLSSLITFSMPHNLLTGSLPDYFGTTVTNLNYLFLSNNLLDGEIPDSLYNLQRMVVLGLDDNDFSGTFRIDAFPLIQYLYIDKNVFTGELGTSLVDAAPRLIDIDVSNNAFSGAIPFDIFQLTNLETIDLHGNLLSGPIPDDIPDIQLNLHFLSIHSNLLNGPLPTELGRLRGLHHLDVSDNDLTGTMDIDEFDVWKDTMTYLFLADNLLDPGPIPTFIFRLTKLRELSLKSTERTGEIPEVIGLLSELILLDLDNNELQGTLPSILGSLVDLQFLLLNRNKLTGPIPTEFGNLDDLQILLVDQNDLDNSVETIICPLPKLELVIEDCVSSPNNNDGATITTEACRCCQMCCPKQDNSDSNPFAPKCHDLDLIPNLDPQWETRYERRRFQFNSTAHGPNAEYFTQNPP